MSTKRNIEATLSMDGLTDDDLNALEDWCWEAEEEGSHYPSMTYEQGIRDCLEWLAGERDMGPHE